ncbi:MAG TPA: HAMP domain-containing sensor histidine kinase, partial [Candidatus Manganitrophaceae bacterium]|nr:HAMP domain-containing sensor histidine kinase [Candidatus Manganitrophaceae bacterium]
HVSHELKTPLNVILGYTSLLLAGNYGELPERAREALSRTSVNAKLLAQMITDLLTLSKMEAMKSIASLEKVDVGAILREVVKDAGSLAKNEPVKLIIKINSNLPLIKSDPAKLKEIFMNLFSNAMKYTQKGSIRVLAKDLPEKRQVRVDVIDTGVGIHQEELFRLFEEFHRVDDPATKTIAGSGLGLSIVKMMVELLQGSVEVKSAYGKGSAFTVFLPYTLRSQP